MQTVNCLYFATMRTITNFFSFDQIDLVLLEKEKVFVLLQWSSKAAKSFKLSGRCLQWSEWRRDIQQNGIQQKEHYAL